MPYMVVITYNQDFHPAFPNKILLYEFLSCQQAELPGKLQHRNLVNAETLDKSLLLLQGSQKPKVISLLLEYAARMRPEGHNLAFEAFLLSDTLCSKYHLLVTQVHSVKESCRSYTHCS